MAATEEAHSPVFRLSNTENELPDLGKQTTWRVSGESLILGNTTRESNGDTQTDVRAHSEEEITGGYKRADRATQEHGVSAGLDSIT